MVEGEIAWPSYRCGLLWAVNRSRASMTHTFSLWQLSLGKEPADSIATCQKKRSGEQTGRSEGKRQIKGKKTLLSIAYENRDNLKSIRGQRLTGNTSCSIKGVLGFLE